VPALILLVLERQAETHLIHGRLHAAERAARRALPVAAGLSTAAAGQANAVLAAVSYEWNQLSLAETFARQGLACGVPAGKRLDLSILLSRIAAAQHRFGEAEAALNSVETQDVPPEARGILAAWRVRLWLRPGRGGEHWSEVESWAARQARLAPRSASRLASLTLARVWMMRGEPRLALRQLAGVRPAAQAAGRAGEVLEITVLEALARQQLRQRARAFEAIWQALALGEAEGWVRVFADDGPAVARLLRRVPSHAAGARAPGPSAGYVQSLIAACDPTPRPVTAPTVGPLTAREMDVLRGLALGQSNREIAGHLGMAVGTVNRHVHRVLGKLARTDRHEAVAEARRTGLV
jgi:LuxR family maltose regulon positive regulatory protein